MDKQLTETSPRVWTGTYIVVKGDMVDEQPVIATLKSDKGVWTEPPVASETKVTIDTIAEIDEIVLALNELRQFSAVTNNSRWHRRCDNSYSNW